MSRWITSRGLAGLAALCVLLSIPPAHALPAEEQARFADGLFVRGLYDLALDEYLNLSRTATDYPRMDQVLYRAGECFRRLDNPAAAERFYVRVGREHPESEYRQRAEFRRAETYVVRGRHADALTLFRAFLTNDPPASLIAPARYYRGHAALRAEETAEAEAALNEVLTEHADSPFASYAALDLATHYASRPERAAEVPALLARAAKNPATPDVAAEALFQEAEWHGRQADHTRSAEAFDRLLREHPGSERIQAAALQAAWAYYHTGRYTDVLLRAEESFAGDRTHPQAAEWWYVIANAQRQLLRADEAKAAYAELIEGYPDHTLAQVATYEKALVAFRQEQHEEAIAGAEGLVSDEPPGTDLFWLLAESYAAVGRTDEAVQYYRRLIDAEPESEQAARALYRLGRVLQNRKDFAQAARTYRTLPERFPEDPFAAEALFAAAFCMAVEERFEEAVQDWDRLLKTYGDHERAEESRFQKAVALMQLGRERPARTAFTDFLKHHETSAFAAQAHYWLAVLAEQEGKSTAAEKAWRAALEKETDEEQAHLLRYRLSLNLQRQEKYDESADLLQALLPSAAKQDWPPALLEWLAVYRLDQAAYAEAGEAARRLVDHTDSATWKQIGWALLGRSHAARDQDDAAQTAFAQSLTFAAHTREGAEAALFLGDLALKGNRMDEATGYYQQAAERATEDVWADVRARAYYGMGQAAERAAQWDEAARYYLSVGILFDDPDHTPDALWRGARALGLAGREAEQARTLDELQERYPDYRGADDD